MLPFDGRLSLHAEQVADIVALVLPLISHTPVPFPALGIVAGFTTHDPLHIGSDFAVNGRVMLVGDVSRQRSSALRACFGFEH